MSLQNLADSTIQTLNVTKALNVPAGTIKDADVSTGAKIDAGKLRSRREITIGQKNGAANVAQRQGLTTIYGATGTVLAVFARNITTATGSDSTSVQIKKNGVNILTAPLVLNVGAAVANQSTTAFADNTLAAGDQLDVDITLSGTAVGQGVTVTIIFDEDPA